MEAEWNALVSDTSNLVSLWGRWGGAAQGPGGILACGSWKGEGWDVDVGKITLEYA